MHRRQLIAAAILAPAAAAIAAARPATAAGGAAKAKQPESTRSYIMVDTLTSSIVRRSGQRGVVTVEAGLDITDAGLRSRAELSMPRLRSAYGQFLQSYVSGLARAAPVNADYLAVQFQRRTDQVLGRTGAKFLIGSILMN